MKRGLESIDNSAKKEPKRKKHRTEIPENSDHSVEGSSNDAVGSSGTAAKKRSREEESEKSPSSSAKRQKREKAVTECETTSSGRAQSNDDPGANEVHDKHQPPLTEEEKCKLGVALPEAACHKNAAAVTHLVQHEADMNAANIVDEIELHTAAFNGSVDIVLALIDANANVNATDNDGQTALHAAAFGDCAAIIPTLIAANANVNAADNFGWTALHAAAFHGSATAVTALITAGASPNAVDVRGSTTLHEAARGTNHTGIVDALIAAGANVHAVTNEGETPIVVAFQNGHPQVVTLLQAHGAVLPDEFIAEEAQVNGVQSVHEVSIHVSVSESTKRLKEYYTKTPVVDAHNDEETGKGKEKVEESQGGALNLDEARARLVKWVADFPETDKKTQAAQRGISRIVAIDFTDVRSEVSLKALLGLLWLALNDSNAYLVNRTLDNMKPLVVERLYEMQREYNIKGGIDDESPEDRPTCPSGSFNKTIDILNALGHNLVTICFVTKETIPLKAMKVIEALCTKASQSASADWKDEASIPKDVVEGVKKAARTALFEEFQKFEGQVQGVATIIDASVADDLIRYALMTLVENLREKTVSPTAHDDDVSLEPPKGYSPSYHSVAESRSGSDSNPSESKDEVEDDTETKAADMNSGSRSSI